MSKSSQPDSSGRPVKGNRKLPGWLTGTVSVLLLVFGVAMIAGTLPLRTLSVQGKFFALCFGLLVLFWAVMILVKRRLPQLNYFLLTNLKLALMVAAMELMLHVAMAIIYNDDTDGSEKRVDRRASLSVYRDTEWGEEYFEEEVKAANSSYRQFVGWRRNPFDGKHIKINEDGIRATWNPESHNGNRVDTILVFGGSTCWGTGARDDYTIPSFISRLLTENGRNAHVINMGETGYTITQEIVSLCLLLRSGMSPDYVVFYDGVNEVQAPYEHGLADRIMNFTRIRDKVECSEEKSDHLKSAWNLFAGITNDYSRIYQVFARLYELAASRDERSMYRVLAGSSFSDTTLDVLTKEIADAYITNLYFLKRLSYAYDFNFICFWQPSIFTRDQLSLEEAGKGFDISARDEKLRYFFLKTTEEINSLNLGHFFDISDALADFEGTAYIDWAHTTERGNKVIASEIVKHLMDEFDLQSAARN